MPTATDNNGSGLWIPNGEVLDVRKAAANGDGHGILAYPMTTRPGFTRQGRQNARNLDPMSEAGTSGLRQYGGFVLEEWLASLRGSAREAWAYREMIDNSAVVGAILFAIEMLARGVQWTVEEDVSTPRAQFVQENMDDMSHTWDDFICEALSHLPYGWAYHELVYKKRSGPQSDEQASLLDGVASETEEDTNWTTAGSEFNDGRIGWRKIPIRAQETLLRWEFDGYSGIAAMEQIDWHGGLHLIPIEKALLFRTKTNRNNPQGRSILRSAYSSWYYLQNIQSIEAIGIERDLAGIPVATPPDGVDLFAPGKEAMRAEVQALVQAVKKDEDQGIVLPSSGWKLELLTTGGARQIDTDQVIRRYRQDIAASCLADFVLVGLDSVGSYAMVDIKSELFGIAVDTCLDMICDVLNRFAIPRLLKLNGMDLSQPPRITHSHAGRIDLEKIGNFLRDMALAGAPLEKVWSKELFGQLFGEGGLNIAFDGEMLETEQHPTGPVHGLNSGGGGQGQGAAERSGSMRPGGEAVAKAETVHVGPALSKRHGLLSAQLVAEMESALGHLGEDAATAYLSIAEKAMMPSKREMKQIAAKVLAKLDIKGWITSRLLPVLKNHAGRVAGDTSRVLQREVGEQMQIEPEAAENMAQGAGSKLRMTDIAPQVRQSILAAIEAGHAAGDNPEKTARRIRAGVPAGRFVKAGSKYRSQLIARTETADLMRKASLALYKSNPNVTAVEIRDGIFGPPRSDATCLARNGEIVPIARADGVLLEHPNCTVSLNPVVTVPQVARPEPVVV